MRPLRPEILEDRCMFALLGLEPLDLPIIGYDSGGQVSYNAASDALSLSATPLNITTSSGSGLFFTGSVDIDIQVDASGALVGGVAGDDLLVAGDVDVDGDFVVDYFATDGPLLTGEIVAFGSQDSGGSTDQFDFRFTVTGGQLAALYAGKDLGVTTSSENSTFAGDFNADFAGNAKGEIGAIDRLDPDIDIEKLVNGVDADAPDEAVEIAPGDTVTFTYAVTNTGSVPFAFDDVDVTDDNGTPSDPGDDVSTTSGDIIFDPSSDTGSDLILSPGETWLYAFQTTADDLYLDDCGCEVAIYENVGAVAVPGAADSDLAHYTNPSDAPPCIAYDSGGSVGYDTMTGRFSLDATPLSTEDGGLFFSGSFAIDIVVDGTGTLVGGVAGDDLVLFGDLDTDGDFIVDVSGTLLTGEVIAFLSTDSGGTTDTYEFVFVVAGGLLAGQYAGMNLHVTTSSENSTFTGDFSTNFGGMAKGEICCVCIETANLSGRKYTDHEGDGLGGNDTPLDGVTINLYQDFGTIGVLDGADVLYASDVTDINGEYSFTNVPAGMYLVEEVVPAGYVPTSPTILAVTLAAHDNVTTGFDFANFELGSLSGKKFNDIDGDGTDDGGSDPGLAGWTIELDKDANGTVDATTVTGFGGTYSFTGLTAGTYRVREVGQVGWIQTTVNPGDVTVVSGTDSTNNDFGNRQLVPGIELKKYTNGEDADTEATAPEIAPGATVTWTYRVRNTGETTYAAAQIAITDDAGTPGTTSDDFGTGTGDITFQAVVSGDADNILEPGEIWEYVATGTAQDLGTSGPPATFNFSGNLPLDGADGNIRTFTAGGVSVKASAFSRDIASGAWSTAYLGSYGGGLGVTDSSEGSGGNNSHTVDNIDPRDNYVLFEFSESVIIDSAFLGYVVTDSDFKIWIGTKTDPFNNHQTLSDSFLASLGFSEVNETTLTTARLADVNAGRVAGNVIVIAANPGEQTREDQFKIEKLTIGLHACYENFAVVTTGPGGPTDSDVSHYCNPQNPPNPGIDIEKFTNGVDAETESQAPEIAPGDTVTWTYKVTNTGNAAFTASQVVVRDDAGTPTNTSDDFTPTRVTSTDVGSDGILSPGEVWTYTYSATAQETLVAGSSAATFNFSGSSATDGTDANIRTFSAGGVSVKTSAFSRDTSGNWAAGYLGSYGGGLGVTDTGESGSGDSHTVDNIGRDNYVLFEFSEHVVVDSAFLGYVVGDSDLKLWIGTKTDPFNNHLTLSDSVLASLGFSEVNATTSTSARTANFNGGNVVGNVLIIAANTGEPTQEDRFKIEKLSVRLMEAGAYCNIGTVTAGGVSDEDASYYKNPVCVDVNYAFSGSSATTGTKGNVLTYTVNNVSTKVSGFSRTTGGTWSTAYVGAYADGLGVTDGSESGSNGTHRLDNVGQFNYLLFEFSTQVTVDRAFLDSIVTDSDITIWIGNKSNPFHNHLTLSDSLLSGLGYSETNEGGSAARWASLNLDGVSGNVLVIAAATNGTNDQFKLSKLEVCAKAVKFYVADAAADDTFEYGPSGQALANYNLNSENTGARGVATTAAGNKVWVLDSNKKVYVYDADGALLGSWMADGLTTPEDITTNGTDIWIVDDGANRVFKFTGAASRLSGSQLAGSSFALNSGNANAKGLVTNGSNIWVVNDSTTDKVFKYTMSGSLVGSWTIDSRNSNPTGITIDPTNAKHIWIVDNVDDAVYRYDSAAGRSSGSQSAAGLFVLASGNCDAQGIADPPPSALDISLEPAGDNKRAETLARELTSGLKDRALADWATTTRVDSTRSSNRLAHRTGETARVGTFRSRLEAQLTALDVAFEVREDNSAAKGDVRDWLCGEELTAADEFIENATEDALIAAFGA